METVVAAVSGSVAEHSPGQRDDSQLGARQIFAFPVWDTRKSLSTKEIIKNPEIQITNLNYPVWCRTSRNDHRRGISSSCFYSLRPSNIFSNTFDPETRWSYHFGIEFESQEFLIDYQQSRLLLVSWAQRRRRISRIFVHPSIVVENILFFFIEIVFIFFRFIVCFVFRPMGFSLI